MTKTLFALVLAGTLAGCSFFAKPSNDYSRPAGTEDQTSADLTSCRQQADAVIKRDANIDSDIAAARSDQVDPNENITITGADDFQRDYVLPEKNPLF